MKRYNSTLPPVSQPHRERIFSMRLTDDEREQIETLAKRLNLPDSRMARHFILEAVAYHRKTQRGERVDG